LRKGKTICIATVCPATFEGVRHALREKKKKKKRKVPTESNEKGAMRKTIRGHAQEAF
jgi:hypothetical protein